MLFISSVTPRRFLSCFNSPTSNNISIRFPWSTTLRPQVTQEGALLRHGARPERSAGLERSLRLAFGAHRVAPTADPSQFAAESSGSLRIRCPNFVDARLD